MQFIVEYTDTFGGEANYSCRLNQQGARKRPHQLGAKMLIRIDTIATTAIIRGGDARTARAVARAFIKAHRGQWGGGKSATVSVGTVGGCWHKIGYIGNR